MSKLFNVSENNIAYHLQNIFKTKELEENRTTQKIRVTASDGINILKDNGTIKREIADKLALDEYNKYRVLQDTNYISDFDELVIETKKLNKK